MWDEEPGSDYAEQVGKSNNSFEFIRNLTESSNVIGPKPGRVQAVATAAGNVGLMQPHKRLCLSLSATESEEDAEDCSPYQEIESKSIGYAINYIAIYHNKNK